MSKREPSLLIEDIILSAEKILLYTSGMTFNDFISDDKTADAVIRNFEIIGEAANRLPDNFKHTNQNIDWHKLRGFRNRIVHDYFGIDYQIVWTIKEELLAKLIISLKHILTEL